jgi:hypothetical protein
MVNIPPGMKRETGVSSSDIKVLGGYFVSDIGNETSSTIETNLCQFDPFHIIKTFP